MQFRAAEFGYAGPRQHHDIHATKQMLQPAETFPRGAFNEIACDGTVCVFLGDGQTETGVIKLITPGEYG